MAAKIYPHCLQMEKTETVCHRFILYEHLLLLLASEFLQKDAD